jgi:hypothetical protein
MAQAQALVMAVVGVASAQVVIGAIGRRKEGYLLFIIHFKKTNCFHHNNL